MSVLVRKERSKNSRVVELVTDVIIPWTHEYALLTQPVDRQT